MSLSRLSDKDNSDQAVKKPSTVALQWTGPASYQNLPEGFYSLIDPMPFKAPKVIRFNDRLASQMGMEPINNHSEFAAHLLTSGQGTESGKILAMAYSGHQFGSFNPTLGDGRAALIGEIANAEGKCFEVQLKGSGRTPYSRGGDGKAALGPVMREYIISEAMAALGIPTTRSLAIAMTGESVFREQLLPGAVLTRIAASHLRIGTFQYFAARGDHDGIRTLADFAIARHYPNLATTDNPYLALFEKVLSAQASLIAKWMSIGFIHGVMNTDNMTISGETIDYGPCAFMDHYDHNKVFSSIDQQGRYAFGAQPNIAQWNLARFAETLLPLFDSDEDAAVEKAKAVLATYPDQFMSHWGAEMALKFGFFNKSENTAGDQKIMRDFIPLLQKYGADYTQCFRLLSRSIEQGASAEALLLMFDNDAIAVQWLQGWRERVKQSDLNVREIETRMLAVNPVYIPRNHLVEEAIVAAERSGDFAFMDKLLEAVSQPYDEIQGMERYAMPPEAGEEVLQTFCGT